MVCAVVGGHLMTVTQALLTMNQSAAVPAGRPSFLHRVGRNHLPALCRTCKMKRGAEIGVWKGAFSELFCKTVPDLALLCVDPWISYPDWQDTKNAMTGEAAEAFMAHAYAVARKTLAPFPGAQIIRQFSVEAAEAVPDGSLDFVYIDGNHLEPAVTSDLMAWAPKVRSGGFVAGHDYRAFDNKPFVQVIPAVTAYTTAHGIDPWFVLAADRTPSFLWVVP